MRRAVGRAVNRAFGLMGLEVRPRSVESVSKASFFQPDSTCQVAHLGFIYELFFGQKLDGMFVEVGAFDPTELSNTSCLADRGWSGLLVEPVPDHAERCRLHYAANPSVDVVEAVGWGLKRFGPIDRWWSALKC